MSNAVPTCLLRDTNLFFLSAMQITKHRSNTLPCLLVSSPFTAAYTVDNAVI